MDRPEFTTNAGGGGGVGVKMTGRKKHSVWAYFDEELTEGKTKRAVCRACKMSIVALVERMIKHKSTACRCTYESDDRAERFSGDGFEEKPIVQGGGAAAEDRYETETLDSDFNDVNDYKKNGGPLAPPQRPYGREFETYDDDEDAGSTTGAENDLLDVQVARTIFATDCSLRTVDHPEFKAMIEMLRPGYEPPSSQKIANDLLYKAYNAKRPQNVTPLLRGKRVCVSINSRSTIDSRTIRVSLHNVEEQIQSLVTSIDDDESSLTCNPQHVCDLALKSIRECLNLYDCKVTSLVTNSNLCEIHECLSKYPDLRCKNILIYGCISNIMELLSNDLQVPSITEHLKCIINYFNNYPVAQAKYGTAGGKTGVNLPFEAKSASLIHKLEYYIHNWHSIMDNRNAMNVVNHLGSKLDNQCLERLKIISLAFVRSQSDTCTIGEATEVWLDLINQLKDEDDGIKIKIIKQFEMATTPAHYLANFLDPRYEGKKLDKRLMDKALDYVATYHPEVMPDLIEYKAHSGPFKDFLFTAASRGNRAVKPIVWWKSLEKTKQNHISEQMFTLNKQLHLTVASSSGSESLFSMFGFVHNKQSDAENQHFQWSHTSEDSYAEANDTNVSGYEADSVLASMMHESLDDYHNQEPIVDVQEHGSQTWQCTRKYRTQGVCDYSDDDGTVAYGNSRKMMKLSRPDTASDEFSTFSDYVAERMRNLKADKALQLMARRDIEQVLFKYEMKLLEQKRDSQQQQLPDTEAATTSKSISPSPVSDMEQQ